MSGSVTYLMRSAGWYEHSVTHTLDDGIAVYIIFFC